MRRIFLLITVAFVILAGGFAYTRSHVPAPATEDSTRTIGVSLAIEGIHPARASEVAEKTTVLGLLRSASQEEGFQLREKEYAGLGTLVEQIGTLENGTDGKYWTYSVNGAFAPVGADVYELKSGDAVEWTFAVPDASY